MTPARSWSGARTSSRNRPARCQRPQPSSAGATSGRSSVASTRSCTGPSRMPGVPTRSPRWPSPPSGRWSPIGSPGWPRRDGFELFADFARLLPIAVIARVLGLTAMTDRDTLRPGQDLDGGGPRLAPHLRRGPRGAGGGHRRDPPAGAAADRYRPGAPRPARGRRHQHALGDRPPGRARLGRAGRHGQRQVHLRGRVRDDGLSHLQRDPSAAGLASRCPGDHARRREHLRPVPRGGPAAHDGRAPSGAPGDDGRGARGRPPSRRASGSSP